MDPHNNAKDKKQLIVVEVVKKSQGATSSSTRKLEYGAGDGN